MGAKRKRVGGRAGERVKKEELELGRNVKKVWDKERLYDGEAEEDRVGLGELQQRHGLAAGAACAVQK